MVHNLKIREILTKMTKQNFVNVNFSDSTTHNKLKSSDVNNVKMEFDASSLYRSALWDKSSVCPKIECGFPFKPHMNSVYVESFNSQTFKQNGNDSVILKIKFYNPRD